MPTQLTPNAHIHFCGAAGKGIAPAAALAVQAGYRVSGDDLVDNHRTRLLRIHGATIVAGGNQIPASADAVVATSIIQLRPPVQRGAQTAPAGEPLRLQRLELVQHIFDRCGKDQIAVIGSVGKSSAAAVTAAALAITGPSSYIGADVDTTVCGARLGAGPWAVTEACEYHDAYQALAPKIAMVLNIVANHEDHFGHGTEGFVRSLRNFLTSTADSLDHLVISTDAATELRKHPLGTTLLTGQRPVAGRSEIVGPPGQADWQVEIVEATPQATRFIITHGPSARPDVFEVPLAGRHAVLAAAMAVVTARCAGLNDTDIRAGLATARLPQRRMSQVHTDPALAVYDDNARLPVQLESLLQALRQRHPGQPITAVISPWGRRNRRHLQAWASAACHADSVYVLPVGDASTLAGGAEHPDAATDLAALIHSLGGSARAVDHAGEINPPELSAASPRVYVTAGYDASHETFAAIHRRLQAAGLHASQA